MGRPRTLSDEDLIDGAARAIAKKGPTAFTLRDVADETGLAPATLIQRFGTKRRLLVAVVAHGPRHVDQWFQHAHTATTNPHDALLEALATGARHLDHPHESANHLALLQLDLTDPELREHTRKTFDTLHHHIHTHLQQMKQRHELHPTTNTQTLATLLETNYHGTLLTWTLRKNGTAETNLRNTTLAMLAEYRTNGGEGEGDEM